MLEDDCAWIGDQPSLYCPVMWSSSVEHTSVFRRGQHTCEEIHNKISGRLIWSDKATQDAL